MTVQLGFLKSDPTTVPAQGAKPILEELPGWHASSTAARKFEDLPINAQAYVRRMQQLIGKPIEIVSVGPEREQVILIDKPI